MLQSALDDVKRMNKRQVGIGEPKSGVCTRPSPYAGSLPSPSPSRRFWLMFLPLLQFLYQVLSFGMIVSSALMIWKGLMVVTGSESPIVVVLRSETFPCLPPMILQGMNNLWLLPGRFEMLEPQFSPLSSVFSTILIIMKASLLVWSKDFYANCWLVFAVGAWSLPSTEEICFF